MPDPNDPNDQQKPTPVKYPKPGDPGAVTKTWKTQDPWQRDFSKGGIQWLPPTYTTHSLSRAPLSGAPVAGASMTPAFAQNTGTPYTGPRSSDIYNPGSEIMQGVDNPMGYPTATPSPTWTVPQKKTGWDFFKSLFG